MLMQTFRTRVIVMDRPFSFNKRNSVVIDRENHAIFDIVRPKEGDVEIPRNWWFVPCT